MSFKNSLIEKLANKSARVAVLGLGYVGLPLAVVCAEAGFKVVGIDPDLRKVEALMRDYAAILNEAALIVDTRNALGEAGKNHPKVVRL